MTVTLPLWALAAFAAGGTLMVSAATTLIGRSRNDSVARKASPLAVGRGRRDRLFRVTEALASGGFSLLHKYAAHKEK